MNYQEFKQELLSQLNIASETSEHISSFEPSSAMKNNANTMDSIYPVYDEKKNFRPCFYPEELFADYEDGRSMEDIVDNVIAHAEYSYEHTPHFKFGDLTSDSIKSNLFLQLINGDTNPLIKDNCAYFKVNDLIAVPRCHVKLDLDGAETGSFLVNRHVQSDMKLTDDELLSIARRNTLDQPYTLKSLGEVLSESLGTDLPMEDIPSVLVLSNEEGVNGSIHMINPKAMKEASDRFAGENLYIIPCSVSELLIMSESQVDDPSALSMMCNEVNATTVSPVDQLSGNIYRYDAQTQKISICNNLDDLHNLQAPEQTQTRQHRQAM